MQLGLWVDVVCEIMHGLGLSRNWRAACRTTTYYMDSNSEEGPSTSEHLPVLWLVMCPVPLETAADIIIFLLFLRGCGAVKVHFLDGVEMSDDNKTTTLHGDRSWWWWWRRRRSNIRLMAANTFNNSVQQQCPTSTTHLCKCPPSIEDWRAAIVRMQRRRLLCVKCSLFVDCRPACRRSLHCMPPSTCTLLSMTSNVHENDNRAEIYSAHEVRIA